MIEYQEQINNWMVKTFGEKVLMDKKERAHRFAEEAIELLQAVGYTPDELNHMIKYVYGRPKGKVGQEVGGTLHCLASLCTAYRVPMSAYAVKVLRYCEQNGDAIRQKHSQKPNSIASNKNYQ